MEYDLLEEIVRCSHDGIYVTDGLGNTLFVNNAYEKMTGVDRTKLIGRNMKDLIKEGYINISGSLIAIEKKEEVTLNQKTKVGKEILITSVPIFKENREIKYIVTNVRDLTNLNILKNELKLIREQVDPKCGLTLKDKKSEKIYHMLEKVSKLDTTILLTGETGTGKSKIAKIIHNKSNRKEKNFVEINCGAIPKNLIESELFGYEPGTFTGGLQKGKIGIFEQANGSTLFLDEVSELDIDLQVKLLKVIEDSYIRKLGGEKKIPINVRIIAATNGDLKAMVEERKFRKDLYYRLNVISLELPPIRERVDDIIPLALEFLERLNRKYNRNCCFNKETLEYFLKYPWFGNIRELKNSVEYMFAISSKDIIELDSLPFHMRNQLKEKKGKKMEEDFFEYENMSLKRATEKFQGELITNLLKKNKNQYKVAKILQVDPGTISRKLKK